jgi:hypothetical protein
VPSLPAYMNTREPKVNTWIQEYQTIAFFLENKQISFAPKIKKKYVN